MDDYPDFQALAAVETQGLDYRIRVLDRGAAISILAPHGGRIEPCTSSIAKAIAGDDFNLYCFEGLKEKNNRRLHITSHRVDEPRALRLLAASDLVVTIHACKDLEERVYVGGRHLFLRLSVQDALESTGIKTFTKKHLAGMHPENICNLGRTGMGIQLEFSRGLRDNQERWKMSSAVVRNTLQNWNFLTDQVEASRSRF
ncbi:MAG TPA: replication protein [Desulfobacteraceae bacterium]|nr:replication protein [Desulfobacteraceae bacterium]